MNEEITFRKYEENDFLGVVELLQEISNYRPNTEIHKEISYQFLNQKNCYSYVAVTKKKVIAYGSVHIYMRVRGGKSAVIEDMVVDSSMRGKGIGRQLLCLLVEESMNQKSFKISLEASKIAEKFYQSCGFKLAGRTMNLKI
jgi:glucosamine-phosphate N-acetyltransferase